MIKKDLVALIDSIFKSVGFKRKANHWSFEGDEIIKRINIQTSSYGNVYCVNYGYDLKGLNYEGTSMHIPRGLTMNDEKGNYLLDFTNDLDIDYRTAKITHLLRTILFEELKRINSIKDLKIDLERRPHNNDVPLKVKEFLGI